MNTFFLHLDISQAHIWK